MSEGCGHQYERDPNGQSWNDVENKRNYWSSKLKHKE